MNDNELEDTVGALLGTFGLTAADDHETVCTTAEQICSDLNHPLTATSYRWGTLRLAGDPVAIGLARWDTDRILEQLHTTEAGKHVTQLRFSTRR